MHSLDHQRLKSWFLEASRDLPWRVNPTPYAVWISEVMLQQTQVAVVIPYFLRWMEHFPTIQALAKAPLEQVIKLWEGLGYYSRARNLHQGACLVLEQFGGHLPDNAEDLSKIKGLGDYTIGAILSFAFHKRVPALDGNGVRVLTRYLSIEDDITKPRTLKQLRHTLEALLPEDESWITNEALIELGATICQKKPKCLQCPLRQSCRGHASGIAEQLPFKAKKTRIESLYRLVFVLECNQKLLVRQVGEGEIMSGLHEFPYCETVAERPLIKKAQEELDSRYGVKGHNLIELPVVSHSFTRYKVQLFPYHMSCSKHALVPGYQWLHFEEIDRAAFSSGHRKILHLFNTLNAAFV